MISTVSQAKYLAHRLTKESKFGEIEKLIPVYLKSGIEVYPHQIAAAYFAVSNPFSKGFILCDEVDCAVLLFRAEQNSGDRSAAPYTAMAKTYFGQVRFAL